MGYKGAREDLTYERAHEVFTYDPETGEFRYRITIYRNVKPGQIAGWKRPDGRWCLRINGATWRAHRVAWLMMTGALPKYEIDHRDLDPSNNRWDNLREATSSQNQAHRPRRRNSKSGHTGVCWDATKGDWLAYINKRHIGHFQTLEEAVTARKAAEIKIHREFMYHDLP